MAKKYDLTIDGIPSVYQPKARKLKIYFCEPDSGVDKETGILLLIPGFGGHANSNVYKKMRSNFADQHNLVTVQCDYFGWEFMQKTNQITFNFSEGELAAIFTLQEYNDIFANGSLDFRKLLHYGRKYSINILCKEKLNEDISNFNDMGIMQALDNVSSVLTIIDLLNKKGLKFNQGKIILYGHSHGAYLSYLCNAFAPNLFSLIVDNSSWLIPLYINKNRMINHSIGNAILTTEFEYLAKNIFNESELLFLPILYKKFINKCKILSFHGVTDQLISHQEKSKFCKNIDNCLYNEISESDVDDRVFKSTNHGLDADYLELFDYAITKFSVDFSIEKRQHSAITYQTSKHRLSIDYAYGLPNVLLEKIDIP